jgi:hypothetical protein
MLKRNNFWLGTFMGLILPGVNFLFDDILKKDMAIFGKEGVYYLLSLAVNLLIMRYYFRSDKEETAKGIALVTFICTIIFFLLKSRQ